MKDLNKMTVSQLEKTLDELKKKKEKVTTVKKGVWQIGKNYVIRTVTMIQVGKLVEVTDNELVLEDCAWVADTGRWMSFLRNGTPKEVEPFQDTVIVGRGSIVDATLWNHKVLDKQK